MENKLKTSKLWHLTFRVIASCFHSLVHRLFWEHFGLQKNRVEFKVRSSRAAFHCSSQLPSCSHPHGRGTSVTTDEPIITTLKMNATQLFIHFN